MTIYKTFTTFLMILAISCSTMANSIIDNSINSSNTKYQIFASFGDTQMKIKHKMQQSNVDTKPSRDRMSVDMLLGSRVTFPDDIFFESFFMLGIYEKSDQQGNKPYYDSHNSHGIGGAFGYIYKFQSMPIHFMPSLYVIYRFHDSYWIKGVDIYTVLNFAIVKELWSLEMKLGGETGLLHISLARTL
jgi:hypothetical protein